MLHVILLILKILGIILLIVLGLLLFVLYAVLFVAVSYRIRAERDDTFRISASAAWLFRIFTVSFLLDEKTDWSPVLQVRVFGHPFWRIPGEDEKSSGIKRRMRRWRFRKKRGQRKRLQVSEEADREAEELQGAKSDEFRRTETGKEDPEQTDTGFREEKTSERNEVHADGRRADPPPDGQEEESSVLSRIFRKITGRFSGFCRRLKRIWKKIKGIGRRLQKLRDRRDVLLEFWNLEEHRRARGALLSEGRYLWKKAGPGKIRGQITFGFADPCHTGLCMGAAGMLCAWYPGKLRIVPDFEQEILKGEVLIKGKMRCYIFVRILLRVYFNKDIRHMYQHWQEL